MNQQQTLAECVLQSQFLLKRYLKGFDDTNCTKQVPGLPNHVAWSLGHLALTMHRTAEKFDGLPLPPSEFLHMKNSDRAYDTESVSFNSQPADDPAKYPGFHRCVEIFDNAIARLSTAVAKADDAKLNAMTKWGQMDVVMWTLIPRLAFHNGFHTGQIADLRRALGIGSIFT